MADKRAKVIMLPTKNKSVIGIVNNKLYYESDGLRLNSPQHLYFTTDEEPKIYEYCYYIPLNKVMIFDKGEIWDKDKCRKIVATTDESLYQYAMHSEGRIKIDLPQPKQEFIEDYVKECGIDEVLIEYIQLCTQTGSPCGVQCLSEEVCNENLAPKVDSDNTITIKHIKDSWSKEEVEKLLWNVREFHLNNPTGSGGYSETYCKTKLQYWINKNL